MISVPENITRSFVYVDCGARGENNHPFVSAFPGAQYIGFEADAEESARVQANMKAGRSVFPVALGSVNATLPFYVTKNPACSSFLEPDTSFFAQFLGAASDIEVQSVVDLPVVSLDEYLPNAGVESIDFIELDTQGSELDILKGAEGFLKKSILGLRVEVEFSPIYKNQPLFSDVDAFVRSCGFTLFDLSRHHYRRGAAPRGIVTSGQLLYGHALYLKDYRTFTGGNAWLKTLKMVMVADFFGIKDYAFEMASHLNDLTQTPEKKVSSSILEQYELDLSRRTYIHSFVKLAKRLGMQRYLERLARMSTKFSSAYQIETYTGRHSWAD